MSFTTVGRKHNTSANTAQPTHTVAKHASAMRHCFGYLKMDAEGAKIGTLIRKIRDIAATAGGGVFIFYKNDTDAESMPFWMQEKSHLKPVKFQGAGWYIWAFRNDAVKRAEIYLRDEEKVYLANARSFQERNTKQVEESSVAVSEQRDEHIIPFVQRQVTGIWASGPPKIVAKSNATVQIPVKSQEVFRVPLMPMPVLLKREKVQIIDAEPIEDIFYHSQLTVSVDSWEDICDDYDY